MVIKKIDTFVYLLTKKAPRTFKAVRGRKNLVRWTHTHKVFQKPHIFAYLVKKSAQVRTGGANLPPGDFKQTA